MADANGVPGGYPVTISMFTAKATEPTIEERLALLEKRVEDLEKGRDLARFHVSQFIKLNLPSHRHALGVASDWVPAHLIAAIRHLESGTKPSHREVAEAVRKASEKEG